MKLLDGATTTGTSQALPMPSDTIRSHLRTLYVYGTFNSTTVKLQVSPDTTDVADASSTWFDVPDASFTADGMINVEIRARKARGHISATATSVTMELV